MSASANLVEMAVSEPLPLRLRRIREQSGMTRSELAQRTGLSRPTIWAWESGRTQPRQSNLQTLARALGISERELYGNEGEALVPVERRKGNTAFGPDTARRLTILIYAAKLGIAALAGVKARDVKISIDF